MTIFTKPFAEKGKTQLAEVNEIERGLTAQVPMVNICTFTICCTIEQMIYLQVDTCSRWEKQFALNG